MPPQGTPPLCFEQEKEKRIPVPVLPPFLTGRYEWAKWPVRKNWPFFGCRSIRTGGCPESGRKKVRKMPSGQYRYKNLFSNGAFFCNAGGRSNLFLFSSVGLKSTISSQTQREKQQPLRSPTLENCSKH